MIKHEHDIDTIVKAIRKSDLSPSSTVEIVDWYKYAFEGDTVKTIFDKDDNFGFIDWIRIPRIPETIADGREIFNGSQEGPVAMVLNCYAETRDILMDLKKEFLDANEDSEHLVWHSKKHDKMMVFKNRRKI